MELRSSPTESADCLQEAPRGEESADCLQEELGDKESADCLQEEPRGKESADCLQEPRVKMAPKRQVEWIIYCRMKVKRMSEAAFQCFFLVFPEAGTFKLLCLFLSSPCIL